MMCHAVVWTTVVHPNPLRLGVLACYSTDTPDLPPDLRQEFLSQLDQCDNPTVKKVQAVSRVIFAPPCIESAAGVLNHSVPLPKVKRKLVRSVISDYNGTQPLRGLGKSVTALSVKQVSMIPWATFVELQNDSTVQWTQGQVHALVNKKLGRMKVSGQTLRASRALRFLSILVASLSVRTSPMTN